VYEKKGELLNLVLTVDIEGEACYVPTGLPESPEPALNGFLYLPMVQF
jgi:hypothetical protein